MARYLTNAAERRLSRSLRSNERRPVNKLPRQGRPFRSATTAGPGSGGSTGGASGIVANYGCGCASCLDKGVIEDSAHVDEAAEFYTLFLSEKMGEQNRFQLVYDPEEDSSDFWESDDIDVNILRGDWPVQKYRFRLTFDGDPKIAETVNLILYRVAGTGEPDRISSLPSGSTSPIASWTNSKFQDILCAFALDRHTRVDPDLRMTFSGACVVCVTPELSNVSTTCIAAKSSGQFFWKNGAWATGYRVDLNGIPTNTPKDSVVDCKVCLKAAQLLDDKLPLTISWNGVDHSGSVAWIPDGIGYFNYPCSGGNTTSRTTLNMSLKCLGTGAIGAPSGHSAAELFIEWAFLVKGSTAHTTRFNRYYYRAYSSTANPLDFRSGPITFTQHGGSFAFLSNSAFYCDTFTSGKSDTWPESITITPVF